MANLIEMKHLCVSYGDKEVVHDINLSLQEGEILAIVGESGSGKSTILKAIMRMQGLGVCVSGGHIMFQGNDLMRLSASDMQEIRGKQIGSIGQNPLGTLNPVRKIGIQFMETLRSHNRKISKKESYVQIEQVFTSLNLKNCQHILNSYPFQLSGGMNQRIAVALAMLMHPKLLLADEPTSALDVTTQSQVVDELLRLKEIFHTSIIIVTHNMGVAAKVADKTAIMYQGQIVDYGPSREILTHPKDEYSKMLLSSVPKISEKGACMTEGKKVLLNVRELCKTYGKGRNAFDAVKYVSLDVKEGEILGIVGESGSGKSTIAKQIIRLECPTHGYIELDGIQVHQLKDRELPGLYNHIQMVFQNAIGSFDSHMKIRASLTEAIKNMTDTRERIEINRLIDHMMEEVGLTPEMADRYPHELSGGQCQRAAVARALCLKPKLLICDEATSALDVSAQAQVVKMLQKLGQEMNIAIIFICHDLALVSEICHRVIVMRNGECVEKGITQEIIHSPKEKYTKRLIQSILTIEAS